MPFEFSVAGLSLRPQHGAKQVPLQRQFSRASLKDLFTLTASRGILGTLTRFRKNWIIQWENFL